jgi:hypothetical protein
VADGVVDSEWGGSRRRQARKVDSESFFSLNHGVRGAGCLAGWARCGYGLVDKERLGDKNIAILAETLPKL